MEKIISLNTVGCYTDLIPTIFINSNKTSDFINVNTIFWDYIFSFENINNTIEMAKLRYSNSSLIPLKFSAVLKNVEKYKARLSCARSFHIDTDVSKSKLFACIETLEIFCKLYTNAHSIPHELSITDGFIHDKDSTLALDELCLSEYHNPYLKFIKELLIPELQKQKADVIKVYGRPDILLFGLIKLLRNENPCIRIYLCDEATDYYSLYKIRNNLKRNEIIYNYFDGIVLPNSEILVSDSKKNVRMELEGDIFNNVYMHDRISVKLFDQNICYWNKCTFCGINKKYSVDSHSWNIKNAVEVIKAYQKNGEQYIWLTDEAIPTSILYQLFQSINNVNINLKWHIRTRIEPDLLEDKFIYTIKNGGVRSLIIGFESASDRILSLMNKTTYKNYVEIAENIVRKYTNVGIHIHFPAIIGFPSETDSERNKTITFLSYLAKKYQNFSFNINILELDVCSELFHNWLKYDITNISIPCLSKYFLGNSVNWNINSEKLCGIQEKEMCKQFKWFPQKSLISPATFYYIWEHMHCVLLEKESTQRKCPRSNSYIFSLSPDVVFFKSNNNEYCYYDFYTHHFIVGGTILLDIYNVIKKGASKSKIIEEVSNFKNDIISSLFDDLWALEIIH